MESAGYKFYKPITMIMKNENVIDRKKTARIAGSLYLLLAVTGFFSLRYVPSKLIVWDSASKTFHNIVASETLFRLDILTGIIGYTGFLILPFVLYKLLNHINKMFATGMVVLAVVSVLLSYTYLLYKFDVLTLIHASDYLNTFSADQLHTQVLLYLQFYDNGILLASILWGLWLFPFGYLVYKSEFLPKMIGIFLMVGCFGYQIDFLFHYFMADKYDAMGISNLVRLPGSLGELGICLWLLIVGTREKR
jgi:Domain of unknown function (DUF4386)